MKNIGISKEENEESECLKGILSEAMKSPEVKWKIILYLTWITIVLNLFLWEIFIHFYHILFQAYIPTNQISVWKHSKNSNSTPSVSIGQIEKDSMEHNWK